jgi:hypothetical protein
MSVMKTNTGRLSELLRKNSKENSTDKKIEILYDINSLIPEPLQLTLSPSMSDDYVKNTLRKIENNKSIFRELIVSMHKCHRYRRLEFKGQKFRSSFFIFRVSHTI